jgi:hypothetical protein
VEHRVINAVMETRIEERPKARRVAASIKMEPEVAEYLQWLAQQLQRDRTFLTNAIVSEHAQLHRGKLPSPLKITPM